MEAGMEREVDAAAVYLDAAREFARLGGRLSLDWFRRFRPCGRAKGGQFPRDRCGPAS
jgi:hypothetical protein